MKSCSGLYHILILLLVLVSGAAYAQQPDAPADTTRGTTPVGVDTLAADSLRVSTTRSGLDTVITYTWRDSTIFDVKARKILLYGDAVVIKGSQKLTAAYIEIDLENSTLYATARYDSAARKFVEVPVFRDGAQEFSADTLAFNFRTKRGTLSAAETAFDQGFYYGEKIKRVDENTLFVKNGRYTTCDAPHPHYYFSSPEMKVVVGDRVLADVPTLNISDVPILPIPLGVFFPSRTGRQSGLIIPRWSQTTQRGFTLEGLGYYWTGGPFSEYFDTRLETDLYSKGGFTLRNHSRIRWRGYIDVLDINPTYGQTRNNPDDPLETSFILSINATAGQQVIGRKSRLGGNLYFSSQNAIRNTTTRTSQLNRLQDITTQEITSNFSYSTSFDWGGSFSLSYNRSQNIITDRLSETFPSFSFSLPTFTPFASSTGEGTFLETFSIGGGLSGQSTFSRSDTLPGGARIIDTRRSIDINPSIGFSPKFGYVTIQPSFSTNGHLYFRRIHKQAVGDTVITTETPGYFFTGSYSTGLTFSLSRLYGIIRGSAVQWLGLTAFAHIFSPTVSWSYTPDLGSQYRDRVFNPRTNRIEDYSVFEKDGFSPSRTSSQNIGISLANSFEAKVAQGDTLEDRKIQLLQFNLSTGYDAAPDAVFRWNPLSVSASTQLGAIGSVNANATFDPYGVDSIGNRIAQTLLDRGEGFLRPTNIGFSFSTSFSDAGFSTGTAVPVITPDSASSRRERFDFHHEGFNQREFFGEQVRGLQDFRMPWQISLSGSYNLSPIFTGGFNTSANLATSFSFSLTPTTKISSSVSYDFRAGEFLIPEIQFYKDLHCWEMSFNWRPSGYSRGFYFKLSIKSPQLQDLKLERQETFYE